MTRAETIKEYADRLPDGDMRHKADLLVLRWSNCEGVSDNALEESIVADEYVKLKAELDMTEHKLGTTSRALKSLNIRLHKMRTAAKDGSATLPITTLKGDS